MAQRVRATVTSCDPQFHLSRPSWSARCALCLMILLVLQRTE
jgi:hypothetical protein